MLDFIDGCWLGLAERFFFVVNFWVCDILLVHFGAVSKLIPQSSTKLEHIFIFFLLLWLVDSRVNQFVVS